MYSLNLHYFDNITTEAQAYVLGYFYARGTGRLQLNKDCLSVLHIIKKELCCDAPINICGNNISLNIMRQDFRDRLVAVGCKSNRFVNSNLPNIPPELLRHFLRALFENYGRLYYTKQKYANISFTLNDNLINEVRAFLKTSLDIPTHHLFRYSHLNSTEMFITKNSHTLTLLYYLFSSIDQNYCQARKFQKYRQFVEKGV